MVNPHILFISIFLLFPKSWCNEYPRFDRTAIDRIAAATIARIQAQAVDNVNQAIGGSHAAFQIEAARTENCRVKPELQGLLIEKVRDNCKFDLFKNECTVNMQNISNKVRSIGTSVPTSQRIRLSSISQLESFQCELYQALRYIKNENTICYNKMQAAIQAPVCLQTYEDLFNLEMRNALAYQCTEDTVTNVVETFIAAMNSPFGFYDKMDELQKMRAAGRKAEFDLAEIAITVNDAILTWQQRSGEQSVRTPAYVPVPDNDYRCVSNHRNK